MGAIRRFVLSMCYLPWGLRLSGVVLLFLSEEVLIVHLSNWGLSSLLLFPGVLACWLFSWRVALTIEWVLLWIHLGILVLAAPLSLSHLATVFISGTFTDIALVWSFGALRTAMDAMRANQELQSQFISNLNHDIKNPLTGAIGALDLLLSFPKSLTPSEGNMLLEQAKFSCEEVARMAENIKDAINPRDDVIAPHIVVCRLDCVVAEMMRYIYTFGHPLENIAIQTGVQVLADPTQVQRVLRNLLHNACKYSPMHSPISVSVGLCHVFLGHAYVCVRDKGSGIPLGQAEQLFQKFSRLGQKHIDGTGLGLYNCKRMIENMGGKIWVESTGIEGEGSSFYFTLPLATRQENLSAITKPYPIIDIL